MTFKAWKIGIHLVISVYVNQTTQNADCIELQERLNMSCESIKNNLKSISFKKKLFKFESPSYRERGRHKTEIVHLLVSSPDSCYGQGRARPKPELIRVSHIGSQAPTRGHPLLLSLLFTKELNQSGAAMKGNWHPNERLKL